MKRTFVTAALIAGCFATLSAQAAVVVGFTGIFAPNQWTTTTTGNLIGASGGSTNMNSTTLVMVGGDAISPDPANFAPACLGATNGFPGPCQINIQTAHILNPFVFDWAYTTADSAGPGSDFFGMLINGVRIQLSDPGGAINQSGHVTIAANSSFGWYINCTDCIEGAARATITGFRAGTVPEPDSIALLGIGIVGVYAARRERRRSRSTRS